MPTASEVLERADRHHESADWHRDSLRSNGLISDLSACLRATLDDTRRLEAGVTAVVHLHSPNHDPDGWQFCNFCRDDYQCRTIYDMEAAMAAEGGERSSGGDGGGEG